ncbi:2OG-Fe(II) oxygenase [Nannocystaceae bacterium ST9]
MTFAEPTRTHSLDDRLILVYDDLFTDQEVGNFASVVMQLDYRRRPSFDRELSAALDCDMFRAAPFLFTLTEAIHAEMRGAFALSDPSVGLSHVYAAAIGSDACGTVHTDTSDPQAITFLYYANPSWRAGWAGETVFYDARGDASVVVAPRPGRLAVFHSNILHRAGIPHPDTPTYRYTVSVFYYPERERARMAAT